MHIYIYIYSLWEQEYYNHAEEYYADIDIFFFKRKLSINIFE